LQDKQKVGTTLLGVTLLALGIYGARTTTGVVGRIIESRIGAKSEGATGAHHCSACG